MTPRATRGPNALGIALALAAAAAALVYDPRSTAEEPKRLLALLLAVVGTGAVASRLRPLRIRAPGAWIAGTAFLAASALSALRGTPAGSLELGTWIGAFGVALAARHLGRIEALRAARTVALLAGGGASLAAIAAFARGGRGFALHGGQGNPNWLGLFLAVCLPLSLEAVASLRDARERTRLALAAPLVLAEIAGLVLSHSRVAWCASLAAGMVLGIPRLRRSGRARAAFAAGLICAALAFAASAGSGAGTDALSSDAPAAVSLRGRVHLFRCALVATSHALPFGAGLGRFAHAFLDAQGEALEPLPVAQASRRFVNATTAHDDILEAAVDSGPIAAALLVAFIVLTARAAWQARWPAGSAAAVAFGVTALGDSPLHQPAVVLAIVLVAAALPARGVGIQAGRTPAGVVRFATWALAAALLAGTTRAWLATRTRTRAGEQAGVARLRDLQHSLAIDPDSGETLLDLGLAELAMGDTLRAEDHLERSRALLANIGTDIALGHAALERGDGQRAAAAFRRALADNPGSIRARTGLAAALGLEGRFDEAEREAETALDLAPGNAEVRALLDRLREEKMVRDAEAL